MGDRGKRLRGKIQVREIFKGESWLAGWLAGFFIVHSPPPKVNGNCF
jgi:hypothetical protein